MHAKFTRTELEEIADKTKNSNIKASIVKNPINNRYDRIEIIRRKTEKLFRER